MEDIQYLCNDGIPFGQEGLHTHTHTLMLIQSAHTCQSSLPADELGHFSILWLRGIKCVVMEHGHIEPKLWMDKSQLQSMVERDQTGCRTEPAKEHIALFNSSICL